MIRYSIIVPVYKVEAVLPRCIESILHQTVSDFELILIDDGSPDESGAICDLYAEMDSRVKVIHQTNSGVSSARNRGLEAAQGRYIVFIDSDDYVDETYLEAMDASDGDLVVSGYQIEGTAISESVKREYEASKFVLTLPVFRQLFETGILNYAWTKRFLRPIIQEQGLRFDERLALSEDTLFTVQYTMQCENIEIVPSAGYHYVKYSHETLTNGNVTSIVQKLELANEQIYRLTEGYLGEQAQISTIRRISPVYKNILSELVAQQTQSKETILFLFRQKWFRATLDHVDTLYSDESAKYRAVLKCKSGHLFCLYLLLMELKK